MILLATAASALIPSILLIWYFWARDLQPEPGRVLAATFGLGVLAVIPVLMVEIPAGWVIKTIADPYLRGTVEGFLGAAAPEELFKLVVLLAFCVRHPAFDEPMDGIVYGAVASLGFATMENVLYVGNGGLTVGVLRALTAVPGHAFDGAILGYYVGQARFFPAHKGRLVVTGYLLATLAHGVYDTPLMIHGAMEKAGQKSGPSDALLLFTLASLLVSWIFVVRRVRRLHADQLHVQAVRALQAGVAPPPGVLTPATPTVGSKAVGWLQVGLGGLLASLGGLVVIVIVLGAIFAPDEKTSVGALVAGGAVLGALPFALGIVLFASGIHRQRVQAPISPYVRFPGR